MPENTSMLETALEGLVGVLAARVRPGSDGAIEEIEVLADRTKAPIQVVGDVKSLLYARFGIAVAADRITVATVEAGDDLGVRAVRLRIGRIDVRYVDGAMQVEVALTGNRREYVGRAAAPRVRAAGAWLAAAATVDAVAGALAGRTALRLEDAADVELAGSRAVVVAVRLVRDESEVILLGASMVGHNELEAGVRATLDAVNRRFATEPRH